jgi:hypothetical protein
VRISKRQQQLERLAWAGGFFDGEGSTLARSETARPGYRQLGVVVPQAGGSVVPEVLTRFAEALPGLGRIGGPSNGLFRWRATDYTRARATAEILRPWIGTVKRDQAKAAIDAVDEQYDSGRYRPRPGRRRPAILIALHDPCSVDARLRMRLDRAWAAGFLDAEGCFGLARSKPRIGGASWYRLRASASQHGDVGIPAAVLRRLHRILGVGRIERHGEPDDYKWVAEGIPAIERVLEVVGPWLGSVKREQARDSMGAFTGQVRLKGDRAHCKRGHAYDRRVTRNGRTRVYCNTCQRIRDRKQRALLGIAPRQFKNAARRYTE